MGIQLVQLNQCPLCKSGTASHMLRYQLRQFQVFQCKSCGLEFIDPSLDPKSMMEIYHSSETLQEINPSLENYYEYENLGTNTVTYSDYTQALDELGRFSKEKSLLEAGSGTGSFLKVAQEKGWQVWGVDSSPENIERASQAGIPGDVSGFLECSPSKKFDAVVFWDLIEHPQDPLQFILKCREITKDPGFVMISAPHYPNILTLLARLIYCLSFKRVKFPIEQLYVLEHTSYFSLESLSRLLEKGGFKVVK